MDYVNSFGTGKNWYDYLLLPVNIFLQHDKFGTFMGSMEMPNPLFLFAFAYPVIRRKIEISWRQTMDILAIILVVQFIAWALGSQQIKFLLPLFPGLCILSSFVLLRIYRSSKLRLLSHSLVIGFVSGMVLATLIYMGLYINLVHPEKVLFGFESKANFLLRNVRDFSGIQNINQQLTTNDRAMLIWDGRSYYCNDRCLPDIDQSKWAALTEKYSEVASMSEHLQKVSITHLFLSKEDISFFLLKHDQTGISREALDFLIQEFIPKCTVLVNEDSWSQLFKLNFDNGKCR